MIGAFITECGPWFGATVTGTLVVLIVMCLMPRGAW